VSECLDISTKPYVIDILDTQLITSHVDILLGEEQFGRLVKEVRVEDLRRVFNIVSRIQEEGAYKDCLTKFIKKQGSELVETPFKNSNELVDKLLEFKKHSEDLIGRVFDQRDQAAKFKASIKEAFEVFLNVDSNKMSERLATYLDTHLKKSGHAGLSDKKLEDLIDQVIQLFRFVRAKDVFESFYQRGLCRRLLLKKSASYEAEYTMIMKLKTECGD